MTFVTSKTGPKILKRFGANLEILLHKLYCNHSIMCQNWKPQKDWLILINVLNRNRLQSDLCLTNSKIIFVFEQKWQACPTKYVIVTMDEILVIICQRGWQGYFLTSSQTSAAVYQMGQGWFCRKEMIMVNFLATDQMQMKICRMTVFFSIIQLLLTQQHQQYIAFQNVCAVYSMCQYKKEGKFIGKTYHDFRYNGKDLLTICQY